MLYTLSCASVGSERSWGRGVWGWSPQAPRRALMAGMEARGSGVHLPAGHNKVGLPPRPFLYTVDQISVLLDLDEQTIMQKYLYFEGRSVGSRRRDLMTARNIAGPEDKPEWRIAERELIRWMRSMGFRYYDRGVF